MRLVILSLAVCLLLVPIAVESQSLAGHWEGTIEIPGFPLDIQVDLQQAPEGAIRGVLTIPAQGARNLPLVVTSTTPERVTLLVEGAPGEPRFAGALTDGASVMTGEFTQGEVTTPFILHRVPDRSERAATVLKDFDITVRRTMQDFGVPGLAIAVVVDGELFWARGFGLRDVRHQDAVTDTTLFAIGSATKGFTAALLATLVDEGRLEWDRPVREILPELRLADEAAGNHLTVRDLLSHRSGLPRHDLAWYGDTVGRPELLTRLRYLQPSRELRQELQYQNLMYVVAGSIAERLTGVSWEGLVRSRLLAPLGMATTNFSVPSSERTREYALPHRRVDGTMNPIPFRSLEPVGPAGSVNSTAADMARWLRFQLGDGSANGLQVVSPSSLREMHTPQAAVRTYSVRPDVLLSCAGLGWFVHAYRGHLQVEHGGNIDGFSTQVALFPHDRLGIAVLCNADSSPVPELLVRTLADEILGLEPRAWIRRGLDRRQAQELVTGAAFRNRELLRVPGTTPSHPLADYGGSYTHPGYGTLRVAESEGALTLRFRDLVARLEHWHYEVFVVSPIPSDPMLDGLQLLFRTDGRGRVTSVAAPMEPSTPDIVFARDPDPRLLDPTVLARFVGVYLVEDVGQRVEISLRDGVLVLSLAGQPTRRLLPARQADFDLEGPAGYSLRFVEGPGGHITQVLLIQPNGVFPATRL